MYLKGLNVPDHLGVILDGNRRWSADHGLKKWEGHWKGAENLDKFLRWCLEFGIKQVSVYGLSSENLRRPKRELFEIYKLYLHYLNRWEKGEDGLLEKYDVRVRFIGDLDRLPKRLVRIMGKIMQKTAKHQKKFLNLLIAYGSHFEIKETVKKIVEKAIKSGKIEITEKEIEKNLLVSTPLNLIIRTGGHNRLSNFLLWQSAYAEVYVTDTLWPDFSKKELIKAIRWYDSVKKNFGR